MSTATRTPTQETMESLTKAFLSAQGREQVGRNIMWHSAKIRLTLSPRRAWDEGIDPEWAVLRAHILDGPDRAVDAEIMQTFAAWAGMVETQTPVYGLGGHWTICGKWPQEEEGA